MPAACAPHKRGITFSGQNRELSPILKGKKFVGKFSENRIIGLSVRNDGDMLAGAAVLTIRGKDAGTILISEGLARAYVCSSRILVRSRLTLAGGGAS